MAKRITKYGFYVNTNNGELDLDMIEKDQAFIRLALMKQYDVDLPVLNKEEFILTDCELISDENINPILVEFANPKDEPIICTPSITMYIIKKADIYAWYPEI